jgi:UDP-arabinose 4-epimerase
MSTVLVTGGAGYIGAHVCKALNMAGFVPVTYDNLSAGHKSAVKWGPLVIGELIDKEKLKETFNKYLPIAVMHFAANALVGESTVNPQKYYHNNVIGTLALLEIMLSCNVKKLIFSSSCATYGDPIHLPMNEAHPQNPINPYGRSKLMIEQILKDFSAAYQLRFASLRYFNAAGADLDGQIGEDHHPETHLIPLVIQTALNLREQIEVFGDDFDTKDGSAVRDYIHVNDLASAHLKALQFILDNQEDLILNLGAGQGFSVFEIIKEVESFCKKRINFKIVGRREGDPPTLLADIQKAKKALKWEPLIPLKVIISSAFNWHSTRLQSSLSQDRGQIGLNK